MLHVRHGALGGPQVLAPDREAVPGRQEAGLLPEGHLRAVYSCEFLLFSSVVYAPMQHRAGSRCRPGLTRHSDA